ncbi:MAG TPA: glycosyltransferase, partial [Candidatus Angelobacter sp.]|nr:glycosyltransferase [Candidatus Angelobacter sp.]
MIHACEYARDVLPVVEGQIEAGMRPFIVTPEGAGTAELYLAGKGNEQPRLLSLLRSWQDVRNWRKSLLDCNPEISSDVVHTHCFAAGMAGVRSVSCVVYDLRACIEEMAISAHLCEPGSWMGRSFRVAEQFVLSRAAAVIVHSEGMKQAAVERGAPPENIFVVPDPIDGEEDPHLFPDADFLARRFGLASETVSFFLPQFAAEEATELSASAISALEGFALASNELPQFNLLLEAPESARKAINEHAGRLGISAHVALVHQLDAPAA